MNIRSINFFGFYFEAFYFWGCWKFGLGEASLSGKYLCTPPPQGGISSYTSSCISDISFNLITSSPASPHIGPDAFVFTELFTDMAPISKFQQFLACKVLTFKCLISCSTAKYATNILIWSFCKLSTGGPNKGLQNVDKNS